MKQVNKVLLILVLAAGSAWGADQSAGQNSNSVVWCEQCKAYITNKEVKGADSQDTQAVRLVRPVEAKKGNQ